MGGPLGLVVGFKLGGILPALAAHTPAACLLVEEEEEETDS